MGGNKVIPVLAMGDKKVIPALAMVGKKFIPVLIIGLLLTTFILTVRHEGFLH